MLLLAQLSLPSSPSSLNEDSLSTTSELLSSRRARRIPKVGFPDRSGPVGRQAAALLSFLPFFPNLGLLHFFLSVFWVHALAFLFHLANYPLFLSIKMH